MLGNSWVAEQMAASQEDLNSKKLVRCKTILWEKKKDWSKGLESRWMLCAAVWFRRNILSLKMEAARFSKISVISTRIHGIRRRYSSPKSFSKHDTLYNWSIHWAHWTYVRPKTCFPENRSKGKGPHIIPQGLLTVRAWESELPVCVSGLALQESGIYIQISDICL
jgi:hypothetical protein